ncbi:hypothetical protein [Parachitinimonas caeni]|uniref:Uncharacterized protein n=1 Tax=Parachitinimonas caeni TaxID=3031301 RepID=A0ABT7DUH5_9NEIS|nr:hypothetical protein [Parachitinimonas caeni]MDK2122738.1 hypothetical protein [Parachitinimonas caeni]
MREITRRSAAEKSLDNVLASLKFEMLQPSPETEAGLRKCQEGEESTANLLANLQKHYEQVRRG